MELNKYQKEAVKRALKEDLFLIHGPFGTGKTTVLVDIILKLIKKGKRILVTADSNNAVDNLLEKLINYTDQVVRIGNLSKVSEKASLFYLDNLIKTESIYEKIKEVKERMEKVLKKRDKYLKPKPSLKRGLSEKDILRLAFLGKGARGIDEKTIRSMANWIKYNKEYEELKEEYNLYLNHAIKKIINNSKVILTTNSSSALEIIEDLSFDYLIHDEASQSTEPSSIIPLVKCRKAIFAGDHKQLPPTVICEDNEELKLSLFERLMMLEKPNYQLRIQYRMNELLMEFPNKTFYNNTLIADDSVKNIVLSDLNPKIKELNDNVVNDIPLIFIDTLGEEHEKISFSKSKFNLLEIDIVEKIVKKLKKFVDKNQISVISPYKEQVIKLKEKVDVEVSTIDGFQGRENEIIVFSLVRSNKNEEIGFLKDYRRLNVAITRAKRKLIIIGDSNTLISDKIYKKFIDFVKKKGLYLTYKEI
ncbi:MAG TPA: IGHMBP2 family helicase [Nautiliaceae bacterium]|nr:IGHMBP2 family helicase [Nautiliaceae bacterium]